MESVKAHIRLMSILICVLVYCVIWILVKDEIEMWFVSTTAKLPVWVLLWFTAHVCAVVFIFVWAWI